MIVIHLRSSYEVMFLTFLLFSLSVCIVRDSSESPIDLIMPVV